MCAGLGDPSARRLDGVAGAGAGGGGDRAAGGSRGSAEEGGGSETPARDCGKTALEERQRPDGPAGALRELGNEIRFRKGKRKVSRERNYHHNGGKNVSRGIGRGESYSAGIFLSVFVIWFGGEKGS